MSRRAAYARDKDREAAEAAALGNAADSAEAGPSDDGRRRRDQDDATYHESKARDKQERPTEDVTVHYVSRWLSYLLDHSPANEARPDAEFPFVDGQVVVFSPTRIHHHYHNAKASKCKISAIDDGGLDLQQRGTGKGAWVHRVVMLEAKRGFDSFDDQGMPLMTDNVFAQLTRQALSAGLSNYRFYGEDEHIIIAHAVQRWLRFLRFDIPAHYLVLLQREGTVNSLDVLNENCVRVEVY
ncbi:hypothetical protein F4679DRAFT_476132 [Xylaria curta]|nr:hypothetical protein F4679DRAFT_476132 [Xylaria curta]